MEQHQRGSQCRSIQQVETGRLYAGGESYQQWQIFKNPTIINIKVCDPWYASPEAYLLYILIIASVILYVIYTYERRRKADLEETKMQFLINATHDIRSPPTSS